MKLVNFNIFLQKDWLPFLNINLKWGVTLLLRAIFIVLTIISIILLLKFSGILKNARELVVQDVMGVTPKNTIIISAPDIDYKSDLDDISNLIDFLEKSREPSKNEDATK